MAKTSTLPLFTVIIPTKDRANYLYHTLRTCMIQTYENLEVIVADDGSTDNTREVVENASRIDSRIKYMSQGAGVGMRENFELALREVRPGYVIALGGDDGLLPDGINGMREVLMETNMEMLSWPAPLYTYPNVKGPSGQLAIYRQSGSRIVDSTDFLHRQAKNLHYLSDVESPMFYVKGVVSTRLIDKVRSRSEDGRFYSCSTPDGYSGIVLAGEVDRYAFSSKPFSIYGLSPSSQGMAYMSNDEKAKISSDKFFENTSSRHMHRELADQPYSPLITLMTVDFLLTARDLPGWRGSFPPIDYRQVLVNGIKELAHGLYGEDRIFRELNILNKIAEQHSLGGGFKDKVGRSRRSRQRVPFQGSGINTNFIFLDGAAYDLQNIFDAAYAATNVRQVISEMKPRSLIKTLTRSLMYRFHAMERGKPFPPATEWGAS